MHFKNKSLSLLFIICSIKYAKAPLFLPFPLLPLFIFIFFIACIDNEIKSEGKTDKNKTVENSIYLSSWADPARIRIESWVKDVTSSSSSNFIPITDRIAVFDNDGTLWLKQPMYTQFLFAIDNLKALSASHPEFQKDPVLKGVIDGDMEILKKAGTAGLVKVINGIIAIINIAFILPS